MEAASFEEHHHRCIGKLHCVIRPQQEELRTNKDYINNISPSLVIQFQQLTISDDDTIISPASSNLPTLALQLHLNTQQEWYLTPHDRPAQLVHIPEYQKTETKSLHLELRPCEYLSYDLFYRVMERNLENWAYGSEIYIDTLIPYLIDEICKSVDNELNQGTSRQNLEMFVGLTLKVEYVVDGRLLLEEEEPLRFNVGMVPASKSSIMQLPERMEIDEDQCLNDDCVICFEQFGKDQGKNILSLPCSHMFHGDCITKWLDKSHRCPICRYDLPTAEQLDS